MVQHQVYYRSTQHLKNNDERETAPNAGHSKIMMISFTFYADILDEQGRKKRTNIYVYLRLSEDKRKAIIDIKTSKFLSMPLGKEWIIRLDNHDVSELVRVLQEFSSLEENE